MKSGGPAGKTIQFRFTPEATPSYPWSCIFVNALRGYVQLRDADKLDPNPYAKAYDRCGWKGFMLRATKFPNHPENTGI